MAEREACESEKMLITVLILTVESSDLVRWAEISSAHLDMATISL